MIVESHYICQNGHDYKIQYESYLDPIDEVCRHCGADFTRVEANNGQVGQISESRETRPEET